MIRRLLLIGILAFPLWAGCRSGDPAPAFTLQSLDGATRHSLEAYRGKVVLVNFWASWCPGCKAEMPLFFDLQEAMGDGFVLLAVSVDNDPRNAADFLAESARQQNRAVPFVTLYDSEKSAAGAYRPIAMPASYLIGPDGVVAKSYYGSFTPESLTELKARIRELLP